MTKSIVVSGPANCFTVGRFGAPTDGITMSLDKGWDKHRPFEPHIAVGGHRVHRDRQSGCHYTKSADNKSATVFRAVPHKVELEGKRSFHTLRDVTTEMATATLVRASSALPYTKGPIVVNGREVRLMTGVAGGTLIGSDGLEKLVWLTSGAKLTVFYEDGAVRRFEERASLIVEEILTKEEMLDLRIAEAHEQLSSVMAREDASVNAVYAILAKMADLIHVTTRFDGRGEGQGMRMKIITDFFHKIPASARDQAHRMLVATLHNVDPILLPMVEGGSYGALPMGVADMSAERTKRAAEKAAMTPEAREAKRLENIRIADEARAAKQARQAEFKAKHKPQPKPAKKPSGKKTKKGGGEERKRA